MEPIIRKSMYEMVLFMVVFLSGISIMVFKGIL